MTASIDYALPLHAYGPGLPYAEIEIRQDLLADEAGVSSWSFIASNKR